MQRSTISHGFAAKREPRTGCDIPVGNRSERNRADRKNMIRECESGSFSSKIIYNVGRNIRQDKESMGYEQSMCLFCRGV